ncbi:MAG TPA: 50S ribosomal protein L25/general stress protein Ctc [Candidatus Megaira endosymbiont of Nemacystus decipiens]|nr:50S ribosomal protein L25/general stress protein Ctc [Candidatus Megaera endosymbiont of Nemacystus decipiens]
MTEAITLVAELRKDKGTGPSRELRRKGFVPATVYAAGKKPMSISIEEKEITKYYRRPLFLSQQFEIQIEDKKHLVLPKDIELNPITEIVRHVDFVFIDSKIQKMAVPIVYSNKDISIGIKRGGYFNTAKRFLNILCPVKNLPRSIEIDVSKTKIGESIKAKSAQLPDGAKLLDNPDFVIASIIGKKGKADSEENTEQKEAS